MVTDLRDVEAVNSTLSSMLIYHQFPIKDQRFIHNMHLQKIEEAAAF